jgi:hypothetical protein
MRGSDGGGDIAGALARWKGIGVLDTPVPQGRGRLRFQSPWKESQEKPTSDKNRARTKTAIRNRSKPDQVTQVGFGLG